MRTLDPELLREAIPDALRYGRQFTRFGTVASYIPELAKGDASQLGICVYGKDGILAEAGDTTQRFSMQSISKVVSLAVALQTFRMNDVFTDVMMEPTGDAFNSIVKLDTADNRPFNPMINAGAIGVVGMLEPHFTFDEMLARTRELCGDEEITLNRAVYESEALTGDRNRAISFLLKSKGVMHSDPMRTVDLYFKMCSLNVNARSLAGLGTVLAHDGVDPRTGKRLLDRQAARVIKTLMLTCGLYDGSGRFAVTVGMPAKSGVGGGIMATLENTAGFATFGPALDEKGNSIGGIKILEYLSRELRLHLFDD